MWRHKYDCRRNAFSMIGRSIMSHRQLEKTSTNNIFWSVASHYALEESNSDEEIARKIYQLYGANNVLGTFVKRNMVEIEAEHNGKKIKCFRTRIQTRCFDWPISKISRDLSCGILGTKYWSEAEDLIIKAGLSNEIIESQE